MHCVNATAKLARRVVKEPCRSDRTRQTVCGRIVLVCSRVFLLPLLYP